MTPTAINLKPENTERESLGGLIGIAIGLILILAMAAMLLGGRGGSVDGAERLAGYFEGEIPFGLVLEEAAKLPSGEVVVRLERDPELGTDTPDEVVFVEYASMRGIGGLFPSGRGRDDDDDDDDDGPDTGASVSKMKWDKDPSFTFSATMKSDRIAWGRWQADYSVVRAYLKGGGWQESVRVNLGQDERPLALFVRWPLETEHSEEQLEGLLRGIHMLPLEDQG